MADVDQNVAEIAAKLTKRSKRALLFLEKKWQYAKHAQATDITSLIWGRDNKFNLAEDRQQASVFSGRQYRLTPLGIAVRNHLIATDKGGGDNG